MLLYSFYWGLYIKISKKLFGLIFIAMVLIVSIVSMASAQQIDQNVPQENYISSTSSDVNVSTTEEITVDQGTCGPMDLVIVLDNTNSMFGAIDNIKDELPTIVSNAQNASGGDLRLGYITFNDSVIVRNNLTTNISAVMNSINDTSASGGAGAPEASDEAKNTSVNNLPGGTRKDAAGNTGTQVGDFTTPYRSNALKIIVLITDAPPGGFNDVQNPQDNTSMHQHALTAQNKSIIISDIFVPTVGDYAGQAAILEDDADTTGGVFITTEPNGNGTSAAINEIINKCGSEEKPAPDHWAGVPTVNPVLLVGVLGIAMLLFLRREQK
jgi:hypothetical protein